MSYREIWAVSRMGSKVSAAISPDGTEISIGVTNLVAHTGVANSVSLDQARELAFAILAVTQGPPR